MLASIVIRTLNEARHLDDLLVMIARQKTDFDVETVLIDSGSTDGTVEIAKKRGARVTYIDKAEFSFGRSLNRGCEFSDGDMLVLISGHCVPADENWLQNLCQPLIDGKASYSYGRQIGDDNSNYSERRIFAKYYPTDSQIPQKEFFCNNANSAILRSVWQEYPFDEELTGLEDMELSKRIWLKGHKIAYVAEAPVFHHHEESWAQVRRRFEREAMALRDIMPEVHVTPVDVMRWVVSSTWKDWRAASRHGIKSTSKWEMLRYRWNQYLGSYKGNHDHRRMSQELKQYYFYPEVTEKADKDEWLKPLYRTSPHEGQQSES
ncbi:glycosyltransferase family 2 protein [Thalassovita mangrovi]|uniref:Glycosyltransferase n=1 Tax=Thalassovita mangrovi TaxID=2692236 RepID=A0A6L8LJ13_9RHOB|nr:glycosyltransferase [Thalassovita mangrovi]MYM55855.1 glycosyltransferase [Thalassovita mangrovi]